VASSDRARSLLKWQPHFDDLKTIVGQALAWERKHLASGS
jgi:UDP-glucose 4-epimerase